MYDISDDTAFRWVFTVWGRLPCTGKISDDQIRMAITAFKNDHPQVFWIANVYSKAYSENQTIVRLYSYVSAEECNRMIQELNQEIKQILSHLEPGLSELDREIVLFEQIAQRCTYDTDAAKKILLPWKSYTIYGLLVDGKAVCEGYARLDAVAFELCGYGVSLNQRRGWWHDSHVESGEGRWKMVSHGSHLETMKMLWFDMITLMSATQSFKRIISPV